MWSASIIAISAASFFLLLKTINKNRDPYLVFILSAIFLRYFMSAYPSIVIFTKVAGLSLNAVGAIFVVFVGFFVIQKKYFSLSLLLPLYIFLGFMIFSGIVNLEIKGLLTGAVRLMYLITLQLALFVALQRLGPERVFRALLTVFILPVGLQAASILLSHPKGANSAGADFSSLEESSEVSYIGPYYHDSGFSIMLLSMLVVAMFWRTRRSAFFWAVFAAGVVGLAYANYRTAILSSLPLILAIVVTRYYSAFVQSQRAAALSAAIIIGLPITYATITTTSVIIERFEELLDITELDLSMSPAEFTRDDRKTFSGRIYIWSEYLTAMRHSDLSNQIIGHGPESWKGRIRIYAHNVFVSYYYEFGIVGVTIFTLYWISNLILCFKVRDGTTFVRIFSGYISFTILCLATMPLWQIEGNLLLALLNGTLMYEVSKSKRSGGPPKHQSRYQDSRVVRSDFTDQAGHPH